MIEGHYTIKIVDKLPKRGNFNWLYAIRTEEKDPDRIEKVYRPLSNGSYQTIDLGALSTGTGSATLTEDITATLDVGGISENDTLLTGTDLTEVIKALIAPVILPTVLQNKSLTNTGFSGQVLEVGQTFNDTFTYSFNQGLIDNKDSSPNTVLVGAEVSTAFGGPGINTSGVISTPISLGSNQWSLTLNHSAGLTPYFDSDGNVATNLDSQRIAGSLNVNSNTITGRYRYWFDVGAVGTTPTTSALIRSLADTDFATAGSFNITIPIGDREVSFYVPDTFNLTSVLFVESSNADVTSTFVESSVTVNDASGTPVTYKKFTAVIGGIGYPALATYQVTIN